MNLFSGLWIFVFDSEVTTVPTMDFPLVALWVRIVGTFALHILVEGCPCFKVNLRKGYWMLCTVYFNTSSGLFIHMFDNVFAKPPLLSGPLPHRPV